jgi:hypothetical protein
MNANMVAELLDETEPCECSCGYHTAIDGKCLRCGRPVEDISDALDLQGEQQEFDDNQDD